MCDVSVFGLFKNKYDINEIQESRLVFKVINFFSDYIFNFSIAAGL